jgi:thiamine kinase-like enzyme
VEKIKQIYRQFLPDAELISFVPLTGGVIHQTFRISVIENGEKEDYVLQRMNSDIFKNPGQVMKNTALVQDFLLKNNYPFLLSVPLLTTQSKILFVDIEGGYWRFFKFIKYSKSFEKPTHSNQLYEAGKAYGIFATFLKDFDAKNLGVTIPDFHNLSSRFLTFEKILSNASSLRKVKAVNEINETIQLYTQFNSINFSKLPIRAVHNDCKLSNILFDINSKKCIAVIDLDTVMPGYIVTDFGDMVRTMCNTANEDETDLKKVSFHVEYFQSLSRGFLDVTGQWLRNSEKINLVNGALYIILEQSIRFLSDYLNEDQYYFVKYSEHNLDRAKNQLKLLKSMIEANITSIIDK